MVLLPEHITQSYQAHKRLSCKAGRRDKIRGNRVVLSISHRADRSSSPLSFAQQRLWFLNELDPSNSAYNISRALRIKGALNVTALKDALVEVLRRHEVLRSTYTSEDGNPIQLIVPILAIQLPVVVLSELSKSAREAAALRLIKEETRRPFDLASGPLVRVTLLQLSDEDCILLLAMHHIISDGWSIGCFFKELSALYEAFSLGKTSPLTELPIQYADFAYWQRQRLTGEFLQKQLNYWREQLAGAPPVLNLKTDYPRPAVQSWRGGRQSIALSKSLSAALKAFSRHEKATLFMTLLTAFKVLLMRYTGQEDIVVGSPIGRTHSETNGLIGFFVNNLILRTNLSGDPAFRELLAGVREVFLGAFEHHEVPFEKLIEELHLKRSLSHMPLVQVAFAFHNTPATPLELAGLSVSRIEINNETAKLDLALELYDGPTGLSGWLEYQTDLFNPRTIARMAEQFQTLLEAIVAAPEQRLSELLAFTEQSLSQLAITQAQEQVKNSNLTQDQLLIWMGQKLHPDIPLYNMALSFTISDVVHYDHFQNALQTIVNSSDALRTVIHEIDGVPQQKVNANFPCTVEYVDLSQASDPDAEFQAWVRQRGRVRFDLRRCLFDTALIKLADAKFVWYLNQHHIIADVWSTSLIFRHTSDLYGRSLNGCLEKNVELPRFQDYIDYERAYLASSRYRETEAYWKKKLSVTFAPIEFYGQAPLKQTTRVQRIVCELDDKQSQQLRTMASQDGIFVKSVNASLFNIFAAILSTYLYRISGNRQLSLGTPFHNRSSKAFKETIGMFMQVLPLHVTVEDDDTFISLIHKIAVEASETLQHRPFAIGNSLHKKIYDVFLNYYPVTFADFYGASMEREWIHPGDENDSFALQIQDRGLLSNFVLNFDFHCEVFPEELRRYAIQHFLKVLDAFLEEPTQPIRRINLLSPAEQGLLERFNETETAFPDYQTITQLFEAQVRKTPDQIAVIHESKSLTYAQLNACANKLAHFLRRRAVTPEALIAISVDRSIEMVIAILGVLKAGGTYVPLDSKYPQARLSFMLRDTQAALLLTTRQLAERFSECEAESIYLDTDWEKIARESKENLSRGAMPDNLAYVIYTSGSTGKPKGVQITHRALLNFTHSMSAAFTLGTSDRVLQFASISFDTAAEEIFPCLARGATLVLRTDEMLDRVSVFIEKCREWKLTVLDLPTAYWHELTTQLAAGQLTVPEQIRLVIIGGERAVPKQLAIWQQRVSERVQLLNSYGPTEATVVATKCDLQGQEKAIEAYSEVAIGRPINNLQVHVLDEQLQPVPVGVVGEVHIGGFGLARGYHARPELTAEKFIPNPFSTESGTRLYKTGDLGRRRSDGNIDYVGRLDHQVKIRGFRIELEEIEAVLGQHPAVQKTVVNVREDVSGEKRLVAYLVVKQQPAPSISELHHFLRERLPEYMLPSAFVVLKTLPLMLSGKVNRSALPEPDEERPRLGEVFVVPRTPNEKTLVDIWSQVLHLERVGIHDNFFELGGDSILSIQVIAKANQSGLNLKAKNLFQYQTIAELAAASGTIATIVAEQGAVRGEVPLLPIQRWFFAQQLPEPHHFNQAMLLEVHHSLSVLEMEQAIMDLIAHHDALRMRFHQGPSGWQQFNASSEDNCVFSCRDLSDLAESEQELGMQAAANEVQASLNLAQGPLIRAVLFDLGVGRAKRLLIVIHHLIIDGVSWRILLDDLDRACKQLMRGESVSLPPKTTSFQHWAERLTEYVNSGALDREVDYWLRVAARKVKRLPVDLTGTNTVASAKRVAIALSETETRALLIEVPAAYHTQINDVLLTALTQTLGQWIGEPTIRVDIEGHGREEIIDSVDMSRTVGWFTTIFPVVLDLDDHMPPGTVLKAVKEQLRAIPKRGIGYGLLRYLSRQKKVVQQLEAMPQAEVGFNYLGQFDQLAGDGSMWRLAQESTGVTRSTLGQRSYLLEITGRIRNRQLQFFWIYSDQIHRRETVEALAEDFLEALRVLILHCQSPEAFGFTRSDFPLAQLDQDKLDRLVDREIEDIYPLSPMQQGMLFHAVYAPESDEYFEQRCFTLCGELNIAAFKRAWKKVMHLHPILRTAFIWQGLDEPLQVVRKYVELDWQEHDWRVLSVLERRERFEAFLKTDRAQGFELSSAPLMRLTLFQMTEDTYQFVLSLHHLLLDRWSGALVLEEVFAYYEAYRCGEEQHLEPSRPFRDYIRWLREQDLVAAEAFWRDALKGFIAPTSLIGSANKDKKASSEELKSAEEQSVLSEGQTEMLKAFARRHQLTLSTVVQGAWALLLSRYSGDKDVLFGATMSGRPANLPGVERMIGLFINTLPVRVAIRSDESALKWLRKLQKQQAELQQYEFSPLTEVQGWSEVTRGVPLFGSILVFENTPTTELLRDARQQLKIQSVHRISQTTSYPLTVVVIPGERLSLRIKYQSDRFDREAITRMLGHLETLLKGIAANPSQQLSELSLLTEPERHQLLIEWNDTGPKNQCIHELFEAQVDRSPEAVAVIFEDEQLTYTELNAKANQLAHYLQQQGVGPETLVGIVVERSIESVVGLLAILKAGGAYLPLDPEYPLERLVLMIEDAGPSLLLTSQHMLAQQIAHLSGRVNVPSFDPDWLKVQEESEENPTNAATADNLAYVTYTSGTTGSPKGVSVPHRAVIRLVKKTDYIKFAANEVFLQLAPVSFAASTFELWGSLLNGARLVIMPPQMPSLEELGTALRRYAVSTLLLTPGLFHVMVDERLEDLIGVRQLLAGGDVLSAAHVQRYLAAVDRGVLVNVYGPTENTTISCTHRMEANSKLAGSSVPIGRPMANTQAFVLDQRLEPVPIGIVGELFLGGPGLARGYLRRPELTAEKFVPHPYSTEAGERLNRTGDLVRWLPDGSLEFVGRIDRQVKLRGFRIDLAEIESVLTEHPSVREAAAIVCEDVPGDKQLVAYVVAHEEQKRYLDELPGKLRSHLRERLPVYMVPSAFVMLEEFPLIPSGKVNRRALPAPDGSETGNTFVPPRDPIEKLISCIWGEVLKIDQVGIYDNFFHLGGHSLLAMRVVSRIKQALRIEVPLRTFFEQPTVAQLAFAITQSEVTHIPEKLTSSRKTVPK